MKISQISRISLMVVGLMLAVWPAHAADAVQPTTATFSCLRDEGVAYINATEYYRGVSMAFTNCLLYATNTATALQGLSGVTLEMKWGLPTTNLTFTPVAQTTNGVWCLSFTCPTNWESPYLQIKITDANTNSYIYPWKMIHTKAAL